MTLWRTIKDTVARWLQKLAESNRRQFGGRPPDCCGGRQARQGGKQ